MSLKKVRNVLDLTCCLCTKRFFEGVVRVLGLRFALTYKHPLWVFTLLDQTWVLSLQAILLRTENLPQNLPFKKYLAKWRKFTTKKKGLLIIESRKMVNKVLLDAPFSPWHQEIALVLVAQTTNRFIESWFFLSLPTFVFFTSAARFLCLPLLCHSFSFSRNCGAWICRCEACSCICRLRYVGNKFLLGVSLKFAEVPCVLLCGSLFFPRWGRRTSGPALGSFRALRCSLLCRVKFGNLSPPVVSSLEWKHPRKKPLGILL
jgi:hypothetical protein